MSFHAYKDRERRDIIYATDCTDNDKILRFYCENPNCDAHLYIKALNSERKSHFCANKNHPHSSGCRKSNPFDFTIYSEDLFNYDDAINNILAPSNSIKIDYKNHNKSGKPKIRETSISKLNHLFYACKDIEHTGTYNGYTIWKILFDCRCNYILTMGISGKHIIECSFYKYSKNKEFIYFKYPIIQNLPNQYILKLKFSDRALFDNILRKIFNGYKTSAIAIAGDWKKESGNIYYSDFQTEKQIHFPEN